MLAQRLVAHRGYQRKYPENTLLAITEAINAGATHIETDIQFTSDLQPVLYHDPFLARVSGMDGNICELTAAEVCALPAFEPFRLGETYKSETIASLAALVTLLQQQPQITAFIEAKEEAIAQMGKEQALNILSKTLAPVQRQAVLISFDAEFIALARTSGYPRVGLVLKNWAQIDSPQTLAIQPDYIFSNEKHIPVEEDLGRFDSLLVVYEITDPQTAITLFNRGADMVETFDIGGMIAELAHHSL